MKRRTSLQRSRRKTRISLNWPALFTLTFISPPMLGPALLQPSLNPRSGTDWFATILKLTR